MKDTKIDHKIHYISCNNMLMWGHLRGVIFDLKPSINASILKVQDSE